MAHWSGLTPDGPGRVEQLPTDDWPSTPDSTKARFDMYAQWAETNSRRYLITEVFWADLSSLQKPLWATLRALATLVFHLRYVVDCASVVPDHIVARFQRFLLWCCTTLVCGPLAALYLFIVFTTLVGAQLEVVGEQIPPLVTPVLGLFVGLWSYWLSWSRKRTWGGTWMLAALWFAIYAAAMIVLHLLALFDVLPGGFRDMTALAGMVGSWLILLTAGMYVLTILLGTALWASALFWKSRKGAAKGTSSRAQAVALGAACLQFALWSVIVPLGGLYVFHNDQTNPLFIAAWGATVRHLTLIAAPVAVAVFFGLL